MITVFGSINLDLVVTVPRLPVKGETVIGPRHQTFPGGKGANQAVAARKAGADVQIIGAVGKDSFAELALIELVSAGVSLDRLRQLDDATGIALIGVEESGENQIIVASGANALVEAAWLDDCLGTSSTLLLQGELKPAEIARAIAMGQEAGARIIWNPAPVPSAEILNLARTVDVLVVNEGEAIELAAALALPGEPEAFVKTLAADGALVVVTLGSKGILAGRGEKRFRFAPPPVAVVDTTGAGDAFCGALASALDQGLETDQALREAVAAGSLACTIAGAQTSSPTQAAIKAAAQGVVPLD